MKKPKNLKKIIFILSAVIFVVSLGIIVNLCFIEPYQNASTLKEIEEVYYKEADSEEETGNLAALMAINSDIKGWIRINDTPINYPVLQSAPSDPIYYLHRNYKKERSGFGSIFLDSLCDPEKPSKNLILYGHNMRDASMFGHLIRYDDLNFYKQRPKITFNTLAKRSEWKIISVFKTNTLESQGKLFDYLKIDFAGDKDFLDFVYDVKVRSILDTPVDIGKNDRLMTLSTCSSELKEFRTVVVAREVREGESPEVDVEKAKIRGNPLMPQGYYAKYGGKAPKINGFENDLAEGKLTWYVEQ